MPVNVDAGVYSSELFDAVTVCGDPRRTVCFNGAVASMITDPVSEDAGPNVALLMIGETCERLRSQDNDRFESVAVTKRMWFGMCASGNIMIGETLAQAAVWLSVTRDFEDRAAWFAAGPDRVLVVHPTWGGCDLYEIRDRPPWRMRLLMQCSLVHSGAWCTRNEAWVVMMQSGAIMVFGELNQWTSIDGASGIRPDGLVQTTAGALAVVNNAP